MMAKLYPITQLMRTSFDEAWFEALFLALDRLHDAVSEQDARSTSVIAPMDMVGWLEDMIYTAQETIVEIRQNAPDETLREAGYVS